MLCSDAAVSANDRRGRDDVREVSLHAPETRRSAGLRSGVTEVVRRRERHSCHRPGVHCLPNHPPDLLMYTGASRKRLFLSSILVHNA